MMAHTALTPTQVIPGPSPASASTANVCGHGEFLLGVNASQLSSLPNPASSPARQNHEL